MALLLNIPNFFFITDNDIGTPPPPIGKQKWCIPRISLPYPRKKIP